MAAQRPVAAPHAGAALISGVLFAAAGSVAVVAGVVSILIGKPNAAHDLAPLVSPADLAGRIGQIAPVLSAGIAAVVAAMVALLLTARRLDAWAAGLELLVLGAVIDGSIAGAVGRIGHATDGAVLVATVVCLMGGAAMIAGGVVAMLGHGLGQNR